MRALNEPLRRAIPDKPQTYPDLTGSWDSVLELMIGATENRGFGILLRRGLLGGALGGLVIIVGLLNPVTIGNSWFFWLLIAYMFFGLPFGLFTGGITGVAIWLIHLKTAARLGPFMRAAIGALIGLVFWGLVFWVRDSSDYAAASWRSYLTAVFLFGTSTGVLTGLMVGSPVRKENPAKKKIPDRVPVEGEP